MDVRLCVTTSVGSIYQIEAGVKNYPIVTHNRVFPANLVLLEIRGYGVILAMDWLARRKVTVDCKQKLLIWVTPVGERLLYKGINPKQALPVISTTRAFRMLKKGCFAYLCAVEAVETQEPDPREIPIV